MLLVKFYVSRVTHLTTPRSAPARYIYVATHLELNSVQEFHLLVHIAYTIYSLNHSNGGQLNFVK